MNLLKILVLIVAVSFSSQAIDLQKLKSDSVALILSNKLQVSTSLVSSSEALEIKDGRELREMTFEHPVSGKTKILISAPFGYATSGKSYPVLFIMSGFQTGAQSLALIGNPGDYILVGYQYPYTGEEMLEVPERLGQSFFLTIGQVVGIWKWLQKQVWAAQDKISILGVSLGSVFMPISLRVAQMQNFIPQKSIFAFGGADVTSVIEKELFSYLPKESRTFFHQGIENATSLLAPKTHLPYLKGSFLIIRGLKDEVFPKESGELLEQLLPMPKKIIHLDTGHINVDTPHIIQATIKSILEFLLQD